MQDSLDERDGTRSKSRSRKSQAEFSEQGVFLSMQNLPFLQECTWPDRQAGYTGDPDSIGFPLQKSNTQSEESRVGPFRKSRLRDPSSSAKQRWRSTKLEK